MLRLHFICRFFVSSKVILKEDAELRDSDSYTPVLILCENKMLSYQLCWMTQEDWKVDFFFFERRKKSPGSEMTHDFYIMLLFTKRSDGVSWQQRRFWFHMGRTWLWVLTRSLSTAHFLCELSEYTNSFYSKNLLFPRYNFSYFSFINCTDSRMCFYNISCINVAIYAVFVIPILTLLSAKSLWNKILV